MVLVTGVATRGVDVLDDVQVPTLAVHVHHGVELCLISRHERTVGVEPLEQLQAAATLERHDDEVGLTDAAHVLHGKHAHEPLQPLESLEEGYAAHHVRQAQELHARVVGLFT